MININPWGGSEYIKDNESRKTVITYVMTTGCTTYFIIGDHIGDSRFRLNAPDGMRRISLVDKRDIDVRSQETNVYHIEPNNIRGIGKITFNKGYIGDGTSSIMGNPFFYLIDDLEMVNNE